jgi:hypothetical protein
LLEVTRLASITFWSLAFSWIRLNLGFLLRENLLLYPSYLPLGVPNWTVKNHQHSTASVHIISEGGNAPKTCVYPHVVYTSVVESNVEASGVFGYMHAHALMALTHAYSRLGFLWKSSTGENRESICANTCYYLLLCHNQTQSNIKALMNCQHMSGQRGRSAGPRIRVSLEIEPQRVGMPPKLVCVHMLCTQLLLDQMLKPRVFSATACTCADGVYACMFSIRVFLLKSSTGENRESIWAPWCSLPSQGPHACPIWLCFDKLCHDQGQT